MHGHESAMDLHVFPILIPPPTSLSTRLLWVLVHQARTLLFTAIYKASSDNNFAFLHFFSLGVVLITTSYTMSGSSIHRSSHTLPTKSNPLNLFITLYNYKGFDLGHTWIVWWFSLLFKISVEFGNKEFMIWAIVNSQSWFCWLYRASPFLAAKNIINLILVLTIWWCPCVESSLVLLEEGVCHDQCVLLAKFC